MNAKVIIIQQNLPSTTFRILVLILQLFVLLVRNNHILSHKKEPILPNLCLKQILFWKSFPDLGFLFL